MREFTEDLCASNATEVEPIIQSEGVLTQESESPGEQPIGKAGEHSKPMPGIRRDPRVSGGVVAVVLWALVRGIMSWSDRPRQGGARYYMWDKRIMRLLTILYIVGGAAALLAPESMGRFGRWVSDNPLYMRIDGMAGIALGVWLALREYRKEESPRPWWRRLVQG